MSKEYRGMYKCRLCGEEYYNCATGSEQVALKNMLHICCGVDIDISMGIPVEPMAIHSCEDGGMGLSDFLGFRLRRTNK